MDFLNLTMRMLVTIAVGFIAVYLISAASIRLKSSIKPFYYKTILAIGFGLTTWMTMYTSLNITNLPGLDAKFYLIAVTGVLLGPIAALIPFVFVIVFFILSPIPAFSLPVIIINGFFALLVGSLFSNYVRKNYITRIWFVITVVTLTTMLTIKLLLPASQNILELYPAQVFVFYLLSGSAISFIYHIYYRSLENIHELKQRALDEQNQKEEILYLYEQITAQEEELRVNYLDVKETKEALELRDKRLQNLFEVSQEAFWEIDLKNDYFYFTDQLKEILGYDDDELKDLLRYPQKYVHPDYIERITRDIKNLDTKPLRSFNNEGLYRKKDGDYIWVEVNWVANYENNDSLTYITGSFKNIQREKIIQEELYQAAFYDLLTRIPNRNAFHKTLEEILPDYLKPELINQLYGAVIILDLDNFRWLNDSFGHGFGDQLLIKIVQRISSLKDERFLLMRLGGDEFAVILKDYSNTPEIKQKVSQIQNQFSIPFQVGETEIQITPSAGVVIIPQDGSSVEEILKHADTALSVAKNRGKNQFAFFNGTMAEEALKRMSMEINLRNAVRMEKFSLVYQPQYNIRQNKMIGVEALLRWTNPDLGYVSPTEFIPIAEANGLINELGNWMINQSFFVAKKLNQNRTHPLIMSINISPNQLHKMDFVEHIIKIAKEHKVTPKWVTLEITETALMTSFNENIQKIQTLLSHGFNFALDDFGTGYSSLNYLLRIPSNLLKIDRSFIKDLPNSEKHRRLVNTIIGVAHDLKMEVIAEGVETEEQLGILKLYECDFLQGYLFNKPLTETDLFHLLDSVQKPDQMTS